MTIGRKLQTNFSNFNRTNIGTNELIGKDFELPYLMPTKTNGNYVNS